MKNFIFIFFFITQMMANPGLKLMQERTQDVKTFFNQKKEYIDVALHPLDLSTYFFKKSQCLSRS